MINKQIYQFMIDKFGLQDYILKPINNRDFLWCLIEKGQHFMLLLLKMQKNNRLFELINGVVILDYNSETIFTKGVTINNSNIYTIIQTILAN